MKKIEKNTFGYAAEMEQAVVVLNAFDYLVNCEDVYVDANTSLEDVVWQYEGALADGEWNGKYRVVMSDDVRHTMGIGLSDRPSFEVLRSLFAVSDYFGGEMSDMNAYADGEEYSYPVDRLIGKFFDKYYDFYSWVELSEASAFEKKRMDEHNEALYKFFSMYGTNMCKWLPATWESYRLLEEMYADVD